MKEQVVYNLLNLIELTNQKNGTMKNEMYHPMLLRMLLEERHRLRLQQNQRYR